MIVLYFQESCLPNEYDWLEEYKFNTFADQEEITQARKPEDRSLWLPQITNKRNPIYTFLKAPMQNQSLGK